jgi:hypothetical protein
MQDRASPDDEVLIQAHARLLQDRSFQFDQSGFEPPDLGWLTWVGRLLGALEPVLQWMFWIGLAVLAGLILIGILREIMRLRRPPARPEEAESGTESSWRPDPQSARDLLAEADRLAATGRYPEAVHLLLLRSVMDIEKRRPHLLRDSLTTREIAALGAAPEGGQAAFDLIGRVVERSLFGGAPVSAEEFVDCRRAYQAFALPGAQRA